MDDVEIARAYDVPPWVIGATPKPRLARVRWMLRRIFPNLVWSGGDSDGD